MSSFIFSPAGDTPGAFIAVAHRHDFGTYFLYIYANNPNRIGCTAYSPGNATAMQRKLCQELDNKGTL
jgi:hypothetical protein